jgi:hypothetical protein
MSDRLAIIAALLAALAASRSIAAEPERLIDITNWGVGDWVFAFIAVSWFLGDLTTGRANAARGAIFAVALFAAFALTGIWYWRLASSSESGLSATQSLVLLRASEHETGHARRGAVLGARHASARARLFVLALRHRTLDGPGAWSCDTRYRDRRDRNEGR